MRTTLVILIVCFASIALADDFKTINGKEYKNAKVSRVEPDGIVITFSGGIVKIPFTELSEELQRKYNYDPEAAKQFAADIAQKQQEQQRFGYDAVNRDAYAAEQKAKLDAAWKRQEPDSVPTAVGPMATSGIEGLSPITVELKNEILNALRMTDKLDALYKGGCSSAEFIAAALPAESVILTLQKKLPKTDPRHDLLVNTFEAYQQTAVAMKAYEQGRSQRPDALIGAAGVRKVMLMKILQGNMTPDERNLYDVWRKATETNP
jgi:hypothetical protein